jgi:hypothetical protein
VTVVALDREAARGYRTQPVERARLVFDDSPHHANAIRLRPNPGNRKRFVDFAGSSKDTKVSESGGNRNVLEPRSSL